MLCGFKIRVAGKGYAAMSYGFISNQMLKFKAKFYRCSTMRKLKISSRGVKFYLLGILSMFILATIYDWEENIAAFEEGFESGRNFKIDAGE